jgi:hypothetical protein
MTPSYASLDSNNIVINVVAAETKEIAQEVTGTNCVLADRDITGFAIIGHKYDAESNKFISPIVDTEPVVDDTASA